MYKEINIKIFKTSSIKKRSVLILFLCIIWGDQIYSQDYEIGYKSGPSLSLPIQNYKFDNNTYELQPYVNFNFGIQSNIYLHNNFSISTGLELNFNKYKILHKDLKYSGLESQVAIFPDYISFGLPLSFSYQTTSWNYLFLGGLVSLNKFSNVFISNAPPDYLNENGDSVHVSFTGNFKKEITFTPGIIVGTGLKLNSGENKVMELQISYSLLLKGVNEINYYSRIFDKQNEIIMAETFNPLLSYINLQFVFYPKYFSFNFRERLKYEGDED